MKPFVTVHTITFNEEFIIEAFIKHYRTMFPDCIIKIYDNMSTDRTVEIAKNYGCEIYYYDTDNKLNDDAFLQIKNNVWKTAETDWVIVCDADEFIHINQEELVQQEEANYTIVKANGFTVVNRDESLNDISKMKYGYRDCAYDKHILFNKKYISEINYEHGCHPTNHIPRIVGSQSVGATKEFKMIHYKWLGKTYTLNRRMGLRNRGLSEFNIQTGWTNEYLYTEEDITEKKYHVSLDFIYDKMELIKVLD